MTSIALCECGCGAPTKIAPHNCACKGWVKGMPQRFLKGHGHVSKNPRYVVESRGYNTPCWIWQRSKIKGYGRLNWKNKQVLAHVFYYQEKYGPVPMGLELDHLCRQPACVNPDHLEAVTHAENCRRGLRSISGRERIFSCQQIQ